jgi:hypothetical protein
LSQKSDNNLILNINASYFLAGILLFVYLGGILLIALIPLVWTVRVAIWALLGWSLYRSLRVHAWRNVPSAIRAIEMDSEGVAAVRFAGDTGWRSARITAWFVHPWLTLLSLRVEARKMPVNLAIAADAVEAEPFRRWRVRLKLRIAVV